VAKRAPEGDQAPQVTVALWYSHPPEFNCFPSLL